MDDRAPDGVTLRYLRSRAGLDQAEGAALADVRSETLSRYENGRRPMPDDVWARYRAALEGRGLAVTELIGTGRDLGYYAGRLDEALGYHRLVGERLAQLVAEMRDAGQPRPAPVNPVAAAVAAAAAAPHLREQTPEDVERLRYVQEVQRPTMPPRTPVAAEVPPTSRPRRAAGR